jgi:hypothetical protein
MDCVLLYYYYYYYYYCSAVQTVCVLVARVAQFYLNIFCEHQRTLVLNLF